MDSSFGGDAGTPPRAPRPIVPSPPKRRGPRRITKSLVALSSAAILTVYAVGYVHTQSGEQQIAAVENVPPTPTAPLASSETTAQPPTAADPAPAAVRAIPATTAVPADPGSSATLTPLVVPTQTGATSQPRAQVPATTAAPAPTPLPTPVPTPQPTATADYKNGTYSGVGSGRHGSIAVSVVVAEGRITSVQITGCMTRYPCSWINSLPGEVVQIQSPRIHYVSGATDSSRAFMGAVTSALANAL
jgi:uncharacterized protein with FMN-binding domain